MRAVVPRRRPRGPAPGRPQDAADHRGNPRPLQAAPRPGSGAGLDIVRPIR